MPLEPVNAPLPIPRAPAVRRERRRREDGPRDGNDEASHDDESTGRRSIVGDVIKQDRDGEDAPHIDEYV